MSSIARSLFLFTSLTVLIVTVHAQTAPDPPFQLGEMSTVKIMRWSTDDSRLLSYSAFDERLCLWNAREGTLLWCAGTLFIQDEFEGFSIRSLDWSPDGKSIATITENGKIQLWSAKDGSVLRNIKAHTARHERPGYQHIAFSPDGKRLVSTMDLYYNEAEIKIWDAQTGELVKALPEITGTIDAIALEPPSGRILRTIGNDGRITRIDLDSGRSLGTSKTVVRCGGTNRSLYSREYSPGLDIVADNCDGVVYLAGPISLKAAGGSPVFSADGKVLATGDLENFFITDLTRRTTRRLPGIKNGLSYELNSNGSVLANEVIGTGGFEFIDTKTGRRIKSFRSHPGSITSLAFSPDGRYFVSGSNDRIIRLWDPGTNKVIRSMHGHTGEIKKVEFENDGTLIRSESEHETITWDAATGKKVSESKEVSRTEGKLRTVSTSPDGKLTLTNRGENKPIELSSASDGAVLERFTNITQSGGLAFTPDGKHFISEAWFYPLQLRDIETGAVRKEFDIGYSYYNAIAFSPDGKTFITGGANQNILKYDIETGSLLWSLFPIDHLEMAAEKAQEARRIKLLEDRAEAATVADEKLAQYKVYISFDHYGDMTPTGEIRMLEPSKPNKSKVVKDAQTATAVWLKLTNDSPLPIEVPTTSMYFSNKCSFTFPGGEKIAGLCAGSEISIWHGLVDANGERVPYGFDFGASAIVLPGTSVVFAVPRSILRDGKRITFSYKFQNQGGKGIKEYGTSKTLRFGEAEIEAFLKK